LAKGIVFILSGSNPFGHPHSKTHYFSLQHPSYAMDTWDMSVVIYCVACEKWQFIFFDRFQKI